jgi:hypothetical protein
MPYGSIGLCPGCRRPVFSGSDHIQVSVTRGDADDTEFGVYMCPQCANQVTPESLRDALEMGFNG